MKPKTTFTRDDLAAISMLMSRQRLDGMHPVTPEHGVLSTSITSFSYTASSPIVEKVMREIGVSPSEMSEAFRLAQIAVGLDR